MDIWIYLFSNGDRYGYICLVTEMDIWIYLFSNGDGYMDLFV